MYTTVLTIHSWIRWIAIVAGVGATFAAFRNKAQTPDSAADRWGFFMMMALDIQMLLGLILYLALSPFTAQAMQDFGAAMRTPQLRFWAVEHLSTMFAAVILAHVGRVLARKAATPSAKRARMLICFGLATVLMMLGTPWPGTINGRPLFRLWT
jgi:heme A synthase